VQQSECFEFCGADGYNGGRRSGHLTLNPFYPETHNRKFEKHNPESYILDPS